MEKMSRRLVEVQEEERRHLARELHDEVGQSLTVLSINLKTLEEETAAHPLPQLAESIRIVEHLIEQVRQLSVDLRPAMLDILGLAAALRWYIDRQARASGIAIDFTHALAGQRLSPTLETACFRVVQEALTNIVRHARTQRVQIEISRLNGEVHLVIQDEGVGFDVTTARQRVLQGGSFGLLSMEERVHLLRGQIDIHSAVGQGTTIRVRFPEPGHPAPPCPGERTSA
jgi:signal transduction histidine kinase